MLISHKHLDKSFEYDGSQIEKSWAFKSFGIKGSSIITWIGPMNISSKNLKDFEDVGLEIKANEMIHFIIEHFDQQPANLRLIYTRQRLLIMILKEELAKKRICSIRRGDDIYISSNNIDTNSTSNNDINTNFKEEVNKLTVSIATISPSSMKIHLGINITSNGTPANVDTVGLFELVKKNNTKCPTNYFDDDNVLDFINNIVNNYKSELKNIELDISKTNLL